MEDDGQSDLENVEQTYYCFQIAAEMEEDGAGDGRLRDKTDGGK